MTEDEYLTNVAASGMSGIAVLLAQTVWRSPGPIALNKTRLGARFGVSGTNINNILRRLVKKGFIRRVEQGYLACPDASVTRGVRGRRDVGKLQGDVGKPQRDVGVDPGVAESQRDVGKSQPLHDVGKPQRDVGKSQDSRAREFVFDSSCVRENSLNSDDSCAKPLSAADWQRIEQEVATACSDHWAPDVARWALRKVRNLDQPWIFADVIRQAAADRDGSRMIVEHPDGWIMRVYKAVASGERELPLEPSAPRKASWRSPADEEKARWEEAYQRDTLKLARRYAAKLDEFDALPEKDKLRLIKYAERDPEILPILTERYSHG
jgi:hypothetical protein